MGMLEDGNGNLRSDFSRVSISSTTLHCLLSSYLRTKHCALSGFYRWTIWKPTQQGSKKGQCQVHRLGYSAQYWNFDQESFEWTFSLNFSVHVLYAHFICRSVYWLNFPLYFTFSFKNSIIFWESVFFLFCLQISIGIWYSWSIFSKLFGDGTWKKMLIRINQVSVLITIGVIFYDFYDFKNLGLRSTTQNVELDSHHRKWRRGQPERLIWHSSSHDAWRHPAPWDFSQEIKSQLSYL